MDFYYDPVLGLQYSCNSSILIIDVAAIPNGFSIDEFISEYMKKSQIGFITSVPNMVMEIYPLITTNAKID